MFELHKMLGFLKSFLRSNVPFIVGALSGSLVKEMRKDLPAPNMRPLYLDAQATTPLVFKNLASFTFDIDTAYCVVFKRNQILL